MFRFGRKHSLLSMTPVYLLVIILIANQLVLVHPFLFVETEEDQNPLVNFRQDVFRRMKPKTALNSGDDAYIDDDADFRTFSKRTAQRRFCCMNPLSGRKRFARDLARKQQLSNALN